MFKTISNCTDATPGALPGANWTSCTGTGAPTEPTWNIVATAKDESDPDKHLSTSTNVVGGVTTKTTVDGVGRVLKSIVASGSAFPLETDYTYDSVGRKVALKSPAGVVTITVYDGQGRVVGTIANCTDSSPAAPPGDSWASCTGAGDHDGTWNQVTSTTYDDAGNKTSETAPNGTITAYTYDDDGNQVAQIENFVSLATDPTMNVTTQFYYDILGRRIATLSPTASGSVTVTLDNYDSLDRLTSEIVNCTTNDTTPDQQNPASCTGGGTKNSQTNVTTSYSYDGAGKKISVTASSPSNTATGVLMVQTDYAYDADDHLCRVLLNTTVDPLVLHCDSALPSGATQDTTHNVETRYTYDANGNLASQTNVGVPAAGDPTGTTTYEYDSQGNLVRQTDPDAHTTTWVYDAAGNKVRENDPDGQTIVWFYDAANRLCQRAALPAGVVLGTPPANPCPDPAQPTVADLVTGATIDTVYTHDAAGNALTATDALASRTITSSYDRLDRPLTVSGDETSDPGTTYTYSFANITRTDPSVTDPLFPYSATLDAYGRQVALTDPLHTTTNTYAWTYASTGAVSAVVDPTGNTTTNTYDPLGRITARSTTGGTGCTSCAVYSFTYNNAGNQLTKVSTISGDTANGTTNFAYDPIDRLTSYTPPSVIPTQTYTWNGLPDRASIKTGANPTVNVTFDAADRPVSDDAGGTYSSDREGRITAIPGKTMVYDALGRLVQVKAAPSDTVLATYTYDALDRLRTITVGSATNRFRYVGLTTAVAQIVDGATVLTNHATDLDGNELFDFTAGGATQTYLGFNDHGDVTWTASTTGAVTSRASYDPYGNLASSSGTTPASRWQGSYFESASGLYYVNARWYSPTLGTFLSDDPHVAETSDPQGRDPYAYASGDPVNDSDPSGACAGPSGECAPVFTNPLWVPFYSQNAKGYDSIGLAPNGPCVDTIASAGCFITSVAMVLAYRHVQIGGQLPTPPHLLVSLTANKLIRTSDCGLKFGGSVTKVWRKAFGARLYQIGHAWTPNMLTAIWNGSFKRITRALRHGIPVIAETTWGNKAFGWGHTHYVVITGWKTWQSQGTWTSFGHHQSKSEFEKVVLTRAKKGHALALYTATYGDFLINDPWKNTEAAGKNTPMFTDNAGTEKHPAYFIMKRYYAMGR